MLLTLTVAWLVLSLPATVVCVLVARGGLREDGRRGYLGDGHVSLAVGVAEPEDRPEVLRIGIPAG